MDSNKEHVLYKKTVAWDTYVNYGKFQRKIIASSIAKCRIKYANSEIDPANGRVHVIFKNNYGRTAIALVVLFLPGFNGMFIQI